MKPEGRRLLAGRCLNDRSMTNLVINLMLLNKVQLILSKKGKSGHIPYVHTE